MTVYLLVTNSLIDFINYAILGIKTFSNKIAYTGLLQDDNLEIQILAVLIPASIMLNAIILLVARILKRENSKAIFKSILWCNKK